MMLAKLVPLCLCVMAGAQKWSERNPWTFDPQITHQDDGRLRSDIEVKHSGEQHDFNAGFSQILTGPKQDPTWHVGAKLRFRRSPGGGQPWEVNPSISKGNDGNTEGRVEVKRTGENTDVNAGYGKVIRGPNRGRETWHVGATHRWRRDVPPMVSEFLEEDAEVRNKRSLQPMNGNPWEVNPSISKGNDGNTEGRVEVKRTGQNTDVNAGYGKVIRGPNRGRETWHVGATHRWRRDVPAMVSEFVEKDAEVRNKRSLQPMNGNPWEVNPSISKGNDGNTEGRVEVKRTGENTDVNAGYGKVIRGPNRGRETWHVGATHRWRRDVPPMVSEFVEENAEVRNKRSLQPMNGNPWEVNPSISKGNDGNTEGRVEVKRTGQNTDVNAGYGKVIRGPNRGRETWHVGATHRWRRDVPAMVSECVEKDAEVRNKRSLQPMNGNPWEVNPSISKGNDGNTEGRVEVKRTGQNTDVNAGYGKVIRGPNRGRETWHVGATHRWRRDVPAMVSECVEKDAEVRNKRSLQPMNGNPLEVNPSISKGNDGNTEGRVEVKRTGQNTDVNAGYGKVIRGPNRGRETWHVGATHRWRRDVPAMVSECVEKDAEVRNKRSLQPMNGNPWEVNPSISKGNDGNTEGRVEVKRTGQNTDVNAGYGKVIRGPNRGRETWHVGATHRWRRDVPAMVSECVEKDAEVRNKRSLQPMNGNPLEVNPSISKGNDGNTEGRVEVKRTGENTDVNAGYGKVIRGPNRGRETWHVGATHRWRRGVPPMVSELLEDHAEVRNKRSLQPMNGNPWEVNPSISKGNDGNTEGRVELKRTGENTDVNAGYGKVIRGPNRGRETWHVGATHRWRRDAPPMVFEFHEEDAGVRNKRSLQPTNGNPWEVNPSISKGNDGNTEGRVEVKRTGENTDVDAGYGKVIRGPNRGRETWHVGATHRW